MFFRLLVLCWLALSSANAACWLCDASLAVTLCLAACGVGAAFFTVLLVLVWFTGDAATVRDLRSASSPDTF